MTHTASHIIIHKVSQPVSFGELKPDTKYRLWHVAVALLLIGFIIGKVA